MSAATYELSVKKRYCHLFYKQMQTNGEKKKTKKKKKNKLKRNIYKCSVFFSQTNLLFPRETPCLYFIGSDSEFEKRRQ